MAKNMQAMKKRLSLGGSTLARLLARLGCGLVVIVSLWLGSATAAMALPTGPLVAYLPPGNAITDGRALLRYSLPIDAGRSLRLVAQQALGTNRQRPDQG